MVGDVIGFHNEGFVAVRANADGFTLLSEVDGLILVAQDRHGYFPCGAGQLRQGRW